MAQEKQKLQKGKSFVTVTGKVKIGDKSFGGEQRSASGYVYSRVNLGVEVAEGVTVYGEMMGGYASSNPVIYSMNKDDNSQVLVPFADRLKPEIVESAPDFKLHKVGVKRDENGGLIIEKFLSPMDVHDYLKENLVDGQEVTLRGAFEFSEYNDEPQRKFIIQNIFLPYQDKEKDENGKETGNILPVKYEATFVQTVLLNEDSFKKITKDHAKEGEVVVDALAVEYLSKKNKQAYKKNVTFGVPITVRINKDNPAMTEKILNALFKVGKGKIREIHLEGNIIEGYDQQEVSNADIELSPEIQELIDMGLYTEDEAKKKMTVRGNKVRKLVFTRPYIQKDREDPTKNLPYMLDDKYVPEDLIPPELEEEKNKEAAFADIPDGASEPADDSWMQALGV
jgi:hypothetical protein